MDLFNVLSLIGGLCLFLFGMNLMGSANVSHELRTPLNVVSGYAEMMQAGLVRSEDVPQISGKIYQEADKQQ